MLIVQQSLSIFIIYIQLWNLIKNQPVSILEQVAADGRIRQMNLYDLSMIISVGYRVNSKRATQFRIWATRILKEHIIQGYTINQRRLLETQSKFNELQKYDCFYSRKNQIRRYFKGQEKEILDLLGNYAKTLTILAEYDKGK